MPVKSTKKKINKSISSGTVAALLTLNALHVAAIMMQVKDSGYKTKIREYISELTDQIDQAKRFSKRKIQFSMGAKERLKERINTLSSVKKSLQEIIKN